MKTILSPVLPVSKEVQNKLVNLEKDSLSFVVDWMVKHEGYTKENAIKAKNEFLVFMSLIHLTDEDLVFNVPIVPSHLADEFWHSFLLFNNKYMNWCNANFGTIVNHFPGQATKEAWGSFRNATQHFYNLDFTSHGSSAASIWDDLSYIGVEW